MIIDKVYIIILNWNGTQDTIECLQSITANCSSNYQLVLVDNGSEKENLDNLKLWCTERYKKVIFYNLLEAELGGKNEIEEELFNYTSTERLVFIENEKNLGFAAGNNVALRYLLKNNIKYAMLLNNDTVIEKNSIELLMNFLNTHNDYVAVTPQIRYFEPRNKIWNCGGEIKWYGNRKYFYNDANISDVPLSGYKNITFITGCALLFKPAITGILTEKFFFGEEDMEFSFRQKIAHRKMACCFSSVIYHKISASSKKINTNVLGALYIYYLSRLIDNRQYSSKFMFFIKIFINLFYAIILMTFRYKVKPKQIFILIITILKELRRIDEINKDYFLKSFKEDFKTPVIME